MIRQSVPSVALGAFILSSGLLAFAPYGQTQISKLTQHSPGSSYLVAQAAPVDIAAIEASILAQVNQYRANQGLSPLTRDASIDEQARIHCQKMANGQVTFGHDSFAQRVVATKVRYGAAAENIAYSMGMTDPAGQAMQGWINSNGHRKNMQGNFNVTGVGVAINAKGEVFTTQMFVLGR